MVRILMILLGIFLALKNVYQQFLIFRTSEEFFGNNEKHFLATMSLIELIFTIYALLILINN